MFSIGFPESPAGHLDHFDIVGLETVIDCGDAGQVRGIDRSSVGEGFGAGQRHEHRHRQTGLQRYIEWTVIAGCFYCVIHAFPATANLGFTDIVIVLGFVSFGSVLQIPGVGGGMQIVTILVLTQFYGVALEAASGVALMLWLVSFVFLEHTGRVLLLGLIL